MCGLVGIVNREKTKAVSDKMIKAFQQMLYCDALRGKHGTGILAVDDKSDVFEYKKALCSADFLDLETTDKIIENDSNVFLLGHNRWATQGAHTATNAHPFNHDHIHLFHNGTLTTYKHLNPGKSFTVDSDALAHYISTEKDTIKALENIDGAFSIVWYDSSLETLNFARNKERPMFFADIKDSDSMLYASESGMLSWICSRNGLNINNIRELPIGSWLQIPLDNTKDTKSVTFVPKVDDYDYSAYYKGYKSDNRYTTPAKTIVSRYKYSYLEGSSMFVKGVAWTPYTPNDFRESSFGYISGKVYEDLEVRISSVQKKVADSLLGTQINVKLTSSRDDKCMWAQLNLEDSSKKKDGSDIEVNFIPKHKTGITLKWVSLDQFKVATKQGCSCCNCSMDNDNTFFTGSVLDSSIILCATCSTDFEDFNVCNTLALSKS